MKGPGPQPCDPNEEQQYPRKEPLGGRLVATSCCRDHERDGEQQGGQVAQDKGDGVSDHRRHHPTVLKVGRHLLLLVVTWRSKSEREDFACR
jgi:hypothetical protein